MPHHRRIITAVLLGTFLFLMPAVGMAESRIVLKDGREIKVNSFWREEGMVKYESFGGIIGIPVEEVERIVTPDLLAFQEAQKADTVDAYEAFIKGHARSEHTSQAQQRIKALQYDRVKAIDSAQVYLDYMRRNPTSTFLGEAKERAEIMIFQDAVREPAVEKFEGYLEIYPEGRFAEASKKAQEFLNYKAAREKSSISEIEAYLRDYPESPHRQELEDRIGLLLSESEATVRKQKEEQEAARKQKALEAREKGQFWTMIFMALGVLVLSVPAVLLFLRMKRKAAIAAAGAGIDHEVSEAESATKSDTKGGPVRYEDLIGAPRKDGAQALPGPDGSLDFNESGPISLPEPEKSPEEIAQAEQENQAFFSETSAAEQDEAIQLGEVPGEAPHSDSDSSEQEIDLSDHETEFKLELEDVPSDTDAVHGEIDLSGEGEIDLSEQGETDLSGEDLPNFLDDEKMRNRRGGRSNG